MISIDRGDINQMSFGFRTISDSWHKEEGADIRTLEEVELIDVSPVTFPAYPDTSVALRSMTEWRKAEESTASQGPSPSEELKPDAQQAGPSPSVAIARRKLELRLKEMNLTMEDLEDE
jgi:hypothetical protein